MEQHEAIEHYKRLQRALLSSDERRALQTLLSSFVETKVSSVFTQNAHWQNS